MNQSRLPHFVPLSGTEQLGASQPEPDGARLFSHPGQESIDG